TTAFSPSMAPRWKITTRTFFDGAAAASSARVRNDGMALNPSMATPPPFRKYRRVIVIVVLLVLSILPRPLPPLKFRRPQHQPRDHPRINVFHWVVEHGLEDLRVVELLFQHGARLFGHLAAEKDGHGAIQHPVWLLRVRAA